VAKKRRITTEQAWILAVTLLCRTMESSQNSGANEEVQSTVQRLFKDTLPEKWFDGQTSDQSWEHVMAETNIQVDNIMRCLVDEAKKLRKDNPDFRI
jgi:hypothetical protein